VALILALVPSLTQIIFTKFMMMNEMEKYYNVAYCFV
jgi:multisubunit Na+/H+ antiporter MnhF subunit